MNDIWCCFVLESTDFADKMRDYGRNNTRWTGGVCDLDSCIEQIDNKLGNFLDE